MKATGILRRIDDLGRVVIPKEIRKHFGIRDGDTLELYTTDKGICLVPYYLDKNLRDRLKGIIQDYELDRTDSEKIQKAISELKKIVDELR